jgi:hypothetical protein
MWHPVSSYPCHTTRCSQFFGSDAFDIPFPCCRVCRMSHKLRGDGKPFDVKGLYPPGMNLFLYPAFGRCVEILNVDRGSCSLSKPTTLGGPMPQSNVWRAWGIVCAWYFPAPCKSPISHSNVLTPLLSSCVWRVRAAACPCT